MNDDVGGGCVVQVGNMCPLLLRPSLPQQSTQSHSRYPELKTTQWHLQTLIAPGSLLPHVLLSSSPHSLLWRRHPLLSSANLTETCACVCSARLLAPRPPPSTSTVRLLAPRPPPSTSTVRLLRVPNHARLIHDDRQAGSGGPRKRNRPPTHPLGVSCDQLCSIGPVRLLKRKDWFH
jgi:hypothetical protein